MKYNPNIHHRRSIRLKGYDYAQAGLYFITLCVHHRKCLFGKIVGANNHSPKSHSSKNNIPEMILTDAGKFANACWLEIPNHFPNAILHEHIIMPNHVHGIIELTGTVGANHHSPNVDAPWGIGANACCSGGIRANNYSPLRSPSQTIGSVVRGFKIGVTKWFRSNTNVETVWQRNYYEHIIRDEQSYLNISNYIVNNPAKWLGDKFYA
jgi:REP element-mobilizing transposase RayT